MGQTIYLNARQLALFVEHLVAQYPSLLGTTSTRRLGEWEMILETLLAAAPSLARGSCQELVYYSNDLMEVLYSSEGNFDSNMAEELIAFFKQLARELMQLLANSSPSLVMELPSLQFVGLEDIGGNVVRCDYV